MEHFSEATYEYHEGRKFDDGTVEVSVTITIGGTSRMATLPVMDYKNKAIISPDARQINDNKQRCFVKAIAMYGLGIDLYRGMSDDLPDEEKDKASADKPKQEEPTAEVIELEVQETDEYTEAWAEVFVEGQSKIIEAMKTIDDLRGFYKANMEKIAILGERFHEKREELDTIFKARSQELEDKKHG